MARRMHTREARLDWLRMLLRKQDLTAGDVTRIIERMEERYGRDTRERRDVMCFKLYLGMTDELPLTYDEIGGRMGITGTRVLQVVHSVARMFAAKTSSNGTGQVSSSTGPTGSRI